MFQIQDHICKKTVVPQLFLHKLRMIHVRIDFCIYLFISLRASHSYSQYRTFNFLLLLLLGEAGHLGEMSDQGWGASGLHLGLEFFSIYMFFWGHAILCTFVYRWYTAISFHWSLQDLSRHIVQVFPTFKTRCFIFSSCWSQYWVYSRSIRYCSTTPSPPN